MSFFSPDELTAIGLSLRVASVAALASLPFGIAMGWLLARKRFPGKSLLDALIHLPLVMPPVVIGYVLLVSFGSQGAIGQFLAKFGISFAFSWTGAALASAIGVQEIFLLTEGMSATTFKTFELLTVVALNYLLLTAVWNVIQGVIETRLRAHELDDSVRGWWQSLVYYFKPRFGAVERRS